MGLDQPNAAQRIFCRLRQGHKKAAAAGPAEELLWDASWEGSQPPPGTALLPEAQAACWMQSPKRESKAQDQRGSGQETEVPQPLHTDGDKPPAEPFPNV